MICNRRRRFEALGRWNRLRAIWLGCLLTLGIAMAATAQEPRQHETEDKGLEAWFEAQAQLSTWKARFTQTRKFEALKQPLESSGRVWFMAPDRFRWELGDPARTIAIRNRDKVWLIYPRLKRAERYNMDDGRSTRWGAALLLLEAGFSHDEAELRSLFKIVGHHKEGNAFRVTLRPKASRAGKVVTRLKLKVRRSDFSLLETEIRFANGSLLRNRFRDAKINPELSEDLFRPELGKEYKVVEPLSGQGGGQ